MTRCRFERTTPDTVTCTLCGRTVDTTADPSRVRANCSQPTRLGLGDHFKRALDAVHVTRLWESLRGDCTGCDRRRELLNRLGRAVGIGLDPSSPLARWIGTPYVTTEDLIRATLALAADLPADIDHLVAVPRSGLIPAATLATITHRPLHTIARGSIIHAGHGHRSAGLPSRIDGSILLVDDTAHSGQTLAHTATTLSSAPAIDRVVSAVAFATPQAAHQLDLYGYILPTPHLLEWNWANSEFAHTIACDFDGVLCEDCPLEDPDADTDEYRDWLARARPLHLPRHKPLVAIITGREAKHRPATEEWLARHRVRYRRLVMMDRRRGNIGRWKARVCDHLRPDFFFESDARQVDQFNRYSQWTLAVHAPPPTQRKDLP